jgi:lactate dehydrogenase-like 2-hydroxyacid dehydrogenase
LGTGYSSFIDVDYCSKNNISVYSAPNSNTNAVAEYTVSLMLALKRGIVKSNNDFKNYDHSFLIVGGSEIKSSIVGIVGFGNIGFSVANICKNGFGPDVIYTSRSDKKNKYKYVSKEFLLEKSDIVILCMDENPSSLNYIAEREFKLMKKTAVLINSSRPHLIPVDEH